VLRSFGARRKFLVEIESEEDGRWIAEVVTLPGVMAYGATREEALAKAEVLALRVLADRLEHGEAIPGDHGPLRGCVSTWPATKARLVLAALLRIGEKRYLLGLAPGNERS